MWRWSPAARRPAAVPVAVVATSPALVAVPIMVTAIAPAPLVAVVVAVVAAVAVTMVANQHLWWPRLAGVVPHGSLGGQRWRRSHWQSGAGHESGHGKMHCNK